jgi:CDP-diacylglycerol--glycerol-3-phosphate 3-phosphatidyltransferase
MPSDNDPSPRESSTQTVDESGKLNVPNALCAFRLFGSPVAAYLAWRHQETAFVWLLAFLFLSDWVDGKLAILLKQRTTFGARLDSAADVALYAALLFGSCWLKWELIRQEAVWLIVAVASYVLSCLIGLIKFRRVPSYHTRAAKTGWLLIGVAAVSVFANWSIWPLRITMIAVTLTNVEAMLITFVLPEWEANVTSLYHAVRNVRRRK